MIAIILMFVLVGWGVTQLPKTHYPVPEAWIGGRLSPDCYPNSQLFVNREHTPIYTCCDKFDCVHGLDGIPLQLNPCAFYRECFCNIRGVDIGAVYIFQGVSEGFRIIDEGAVIPEYRLENYSSINHGQFFLDMERNVVNELSEGKISVSTTAPHCVHAIGAVEKKDGSLRPITDCKRPIGLSINNFMSTTALTFRFKTLDYVAENIVTPNCFLAVVDITSAYRSVSIYPPHKIFHGFRWGDVYYTDNRLSFGLKCAPYVFTCISNFVVRIMGRYGYTCVNYIDDFLCYGESIDICQDCQTLLVKILNSLGFRVSVEKMIMPSQKVQYLGMCIDTVNMEYSLPGRKLAKLGPLVDSFIDRHHATKLELQSLAGVLSHCSYAVRGGRVFTRRIINLIKTLPGDRAVGHLNGMIKSDLTWWKSFSVMFNGKAKIIGPPSDGDIFFCTDASLSGFGAVYADDFLLGTWSTPSSDLQFWVDSLHWGQPPEFVSVGTDINELEMWPVLCSVSRWGHTWRNKRVILYTDNNQVLYAINDNKSRNNKVMGWLREIFWSSFVYNFYLTASRIPSSENVLPDCLSRITTVSARSLGARLLKAGHYNFRSLANPHGGSNVP